MSMLGFHISLGDLSLQDLPLVIDDEDIAWALRNTLVILVGSAAASMQEGSLFSKVVYREFSCYLAGYNAGIIGSFASNPAAVMELKWLKLKPFRSQR